MRYDTIDDFYSHINSLNISDEDKSLIINTFKSEHSALEQLANNDANLRYEIAQLKQELQMHRLTIDKMVKVPYTYGIKLSTDEEANNDNNRWLIV